MDLYLLKNPDGIKKRLFYVDNKNKIFQSNSNFQGDFLKKIQKIEDDEIFKKASSDNLNVDKIQNVINLFF